MMTLFNKLILGTLGLLPASVVLAAPALGAVEKQPLNLNAIGMFFVFVLGTLAITWWAAPIHFGLLHSRRRYQRLSEWPGDCR